MPMISAESESSMSNNNYRALCVALLLYCHTAIAQDATLTAQPRDVVCQAMTPCDGDVMSLVGTWHITSEADEFGGLSGLTISNNGESFTAVSDSGVLWRGTLAWQNGAVSALSDLTSRALTSGEPHKSERDSESIRAMDDATWVISFEHQHRLERHTDTHMLERIALPSSITNLLADNGGIEAFVPLQDGSYLLFAEDSEIDDTHSRAWHWQPNGMTTELRYQHPEGFAPTDAVQLKDGSIILTERAYSLWRFRMSTRIVALSLPPTLTDGTTLTTTTLVEAGGVLDNAEGITHFTRNGTRYIATISDDNFMPFQNTVLSVWHLK